MIDYSSVERALATFKLAEAKTAAGRTEEAACKAAVDEMLKAGDTSAGAAANLVNLDAQARIFPGKVKICVCEEEVALGGLREALRSCSKAAFAYRDGVRKDQESRIRSFLAELPIISKFGPDILANVLAGSAHLQIAARHAERLAVAARAEAKEAVLAAVQEVLSHRLFTEERPGDLKGVTRQIVSMPAPQNIRFRPAPLDLARGFVPFFPGAMGSAAWGQSTSAHLAEATAAGCHYGTLPPLVFARLTLRPGVRQ